MNYINKLEGLSLKNLRVLNISSNNLRNLENLENLISLECIDVSKNKISSLGCLEKFVLKKLKRFLCSHNLFSQQYLDTLEKRFHEFPKLEELDFLGNEIILCKSFIPTMSHLFFLKILNGVPVFKPEIFQIFSRKTNEKQKSDIKPSLVDIDFTQTSSLKDVFSDQTVQKKK